MVGVCVPLCIWIPFGQGHGLGCATQKRSKRRLVEKCLLVCLLRWLAPRRVLSLPLRCVRFMRLARGTPTRPPKVRAARSPLLPRALRCSLR